MSENFTLTESEISKGLAGVGMSWDDFKKNKKKKMTSFDKEPLDLLDEKDVNYLSEIIDIKDVYERSKLIVNGKNRRRIITNNSN